MDQYDTSQLTEFPRFEPESTQSGVSTFLNKLWKLPIFSPGETAENSQKALTDGKEDSPHNEDGSKQEYDDIKTEPASYAVEFEGRSLQNVLSRITSLVALGSSRGTKYTDTEHARYWMPDDISRECYECAARFGALRRRHHCRVCGQIFCARCCSQRVPGQIFGCAGGLRVCNYCCNVVLSYLRENDMTGEISPDLRTLQENLQVKFPDNKSQAAKSRDHFMFARDQDERPAPSHKEALHDVCRQLALMLPTRQHRYRLVRYNGVWRGCDVLQWITDNTSHKTRAQATLVCQSLLSAGLMECVTDSAQFADYALYRPTPPPPAADNTPDEEHTRLVESVSSYCLDLDLGESSARLTKNPKAESTEPKSPSSGEETPNLEQTEGPMETTKLCKALEASGEDHLKRLMRQFLASYSLSSAWLDVLLPLCVQAAETIMPDMHSSDIDVRNYVQVKKLRDGTIKDCRVIPGVVLTKNVAHRAMPQRIENPSVLLLDCSIAYQRVEGKLTSLEPVLLQEQEYLVRCAARISALRPDVVLVRGSAARAVQDALRAAGVALATNVRPRALARAARCLRADPAASVDARVAAPRLGACRLFAVSGRECPARWSDVVPVRGSAARAVQDALRAAGVALATNVRPRALARAARCLRADPAASVDARVAAPRLGACRLFAVSGRECPARWSDVVPVRGSAARAVQDALRAAGVALATNVRPRALARAARCLRADPAASVDARVAAPRLGACRLFAVSGRECPARWSDVVPVRGSAARAVQDALRAAGVALATNVRPRALARAARCLRADPAASVDARVAAPRLGACRLFAVSGRECPARWSDVVPVRGSAARAVQDALRAAGVALATNVRPRALARAARCLRADPAASVDARVAAPRLGACRLFAVSGRECPARWSDVVPVRGSAARAVQDALRAAGVALATNVRPRALARAARCLRADPAASVDARVAAPRLGACRLFAVSGRECPARWSDVVPVRGSAARAVQDALRAAGVALATNVRPRALARAARCLRADPAASVDARVAAPRLGACRLFAVSGHPSKTLMSLEGCAEPHLGCCILLCGAPISELARVKKIVKFMLLACYNWKLEKAFLADIEAILPEPGMTFDDDENDKTVEKNSADAVENDIAKDEIQNEINNEVEAEKTKANTDDIKHVDENIETGDKSSEVETGSDLKAKSFDDPLTSKFVRKPESERLSCGVPIRDFSDPLRATMSVDDEVFLPTEEDLKADSQAERWSIDDTILSMSPSVVIPPPCLEERGRRCPLRQHPRPAPPTPRPRRQSAKNTALPVKEVHPFIARPIAAPADDPALRAALAHYRATGCPLDCKHKPECPMYKPSVVKKVKEPEVEEKPIGKEYLDPLDPENHQKLSVLLYSYSKKSANAPDFCVNPWIVTMEMYGRHDITLGAFLEKYCFNSEYKCPSNNCSVPVNQHVRRFVHGDACITITCNIIQHSSVDKMKDDQNKQVMFWSRCEVCGASGRARRLSRAALSLSLAVYLRGRAAAARAATLRSCRHALAAHAHVLARATAAACCRYMKITPYEIELPPEVISVQYDTKAMRDSLINQLNELMLKGHETFSNVADTECEKDYQAFKHHTEQIHLALTHANLQGNNTKAAIVRSLWNVSDRIILGEKMLRDAQEQWASPAVKSKPPPDAPAEEKSDVEESGEAIESTETSKDEKDHAGIEEDEEKGDKKTVRQILSQLLSNKEASNQSGIIIVSGMIPVVVMVGEIGSVIAATLASVTYQRTLRTQRHSNQSEQEESETPTGGKEKTDGDKNKAAKSNDHIEVLLKDGLLCRVYYAPQFHKLRHMLMAAPDSPDAGRCCDVDKADSKTLCDIEEGFIRSLAHCVPWAAKGGKSGSTFCKTKDDRYVLKEMTKPEWQQFLEFAPHYFNYVTSCRNQQLPSLLARILGVYSVGGAGNGVLVMENVWHSCAGRRFDLKGSSRHRLAPPAPLAVLLDENLLQLRWDEQLFIQSHTGRVLFASIDRDTELLSANSVMDYSLLLGIEGRRLVVGIIDYIRTFTWDKKLEHLVKKNLGSGQPTVVSPDEYKRRFRAATRKYFLRCVGPWDHLL